MSRGTLLVTAGVFTQRGTEAIARLTEAGFELRHSSHPGPLTETELIAELQGCVGVLAATDPYNETVLSACPDLRLIARWGIGYDSVDVAAATRHGVMLVNTPGAVTEAVADMTFALMLGVARRIPYGDRAVRAGSWPTIFAGQLHGKILGLVGFGQIGQAVARRARGFAMRILATDPCADPQALADLGAEAVPLEILLAESDFVSLHATMCPETAGMIGREQLRLMKATAYLINAGRGGLVDQAALTAALNEGWIAGAGLDVLRDEPPDAADPLLQVENAVFMPHCSSFTYDTVALVNQRVVDNVLEAMSGVRPRFLVNGEVWKGN